MYAAGMNYARAVALLLKQPHTSRLNDSMKSLLRRMRSARTAAACDCLAGVNWDADLKPFRKWLAASLTHLPLSDRVAGLWFYVPDIALNPSMTYLVGCSWFDEREAQSDWASDVIWTQDAKGRRGRSVPRSHPSEFMLTALARGASILDVGPESSSLQPPSEDTINLALACCLAHAGLLIRHALPDLPPELLFGTRPWRGVGFGFVDGELMLAGVIQADGWTRPAMSFRVARPGRERSTPRRDGRPVVEMNDDFSVRLYLKAGGDPHAVSPDGHTLLLKALSPSVFGDAKPDYPLARELLDMRISPNARALGGYHAMLELVSAPLPLLKRALALGGDPNLKNEMGHSPMHACVTEVGAPQVLPILAKAGGDVNLPGILGRSLFHQVNEFAGSMMTQRTLRPTMRVLGKLGADPDQRDACGLTPLADACLKYTEDFRSGGSARESGFPQVIRELLAIGADPNTRLAAGAPAVYPAKGTPLMCPRYEDGGLHIDMLKHGADPLVTCAKGKSAIDHAREALRRPGTRDKRGIQRALDAMLAAAEKGTGAPRHPRAAPGTGAGGAKSARGKPAKVREARVSSSSRRV